MPELKVLQLGRLLNCLGLIPKKPQGHRWNQKRHQSFNLDKIKILARSFGHTSKQTDELGLIA